MIGGVVFAAALSHVWPCMQKVIPRKEGVVV